LPGPPVPALNGSDILGVLLLAIVPGLLALLLYYFGLRGTTASAATLAELAFSPDGRKAQLRRVRNHADLEPGAGAVLLAGTITVTSLLSRVRDEATGVSTRSLPLGENA